MLKIEIKDKNINRGLKELKTKFIKTKITKELVGRKSFKKKGEKRREEIENAIYKEKKKKKQSI